MRIRVWNAFASNNSGSYTIVGSFPTREAASEIAAELAELMSAHTLWHDLQRPKPKSSPEEESPLQAFVKKHDLTWSANGERDDEWPEHAGNNTPDAFAVGHNVVIHHGYTVTLPRVFGAYFYARGGRVTHEINHAHRSIVGVIHFWVPWKERSGVDTAAMVADFVEKLHADDGPLVTEVALGHEPAWQARNGFGEGDLTVGAVFDDLVTGFTAVMEIAEAHGLEAQVQVFEAFGDDDPLAFLRPSWPPLEAKRFSVVMEASGDAFEVENALEQLTNEDDMTVKKLLASLPVTVMSGAVQGRAERAAALLRDAGATVTVEEERPAE